jgi:hypothetical protein
MPAVHAPERRSAPERAGTTGGSTRPLGRARRGASRREQLVCMAGPQQDSFAPDHQDTCAPGPPVDEGRVSAVGVRCDNTTPCAEKRVPPPQHPEVIRRRDHFARSVPRKEHEPDRDEDEPDSDVQSQLTPRDRRREPGPVSRRAACVGRQRPACISGTSARQPNKSRRECRRDENHPAVGEHGHRSKQPDRDRYRLDGASGYGRAGNAPTDQRVERQQDLAEHTWTCHRFGDVGHMTLGDRGQPNAARRRRSVRSDRDRQNYGGVGTAISRSGSPPSMRSRPPGTRASARRSSARSPAWGYRPSNAPTRTAKARS